MNLLAPFVTLFRFANAAGTAMLVGQVGWWCYKKYNELNKNKLRSGEVRERFLAEFMKEFKRLPTEEELKVAMKAADAVDRPFQHQIREFFASLLPAEKK